MQRIILALLSLLAFSGPGSAQPAGEDAARHMAVARYYVGRGDHAGAINRLKHVVMQSPSSEHIEEALARLTEEYLALGVAREAQITAAALLRRFPDSPWAARALRALAAAGLAPAEGR